MAAASLTAEKKPYAYRCQRCMNPLVGRWVTSENRPDDPTDDTVMCFVCARVLPVDEMKPSGSTDLAWFVGIVFVVAAFIGGAYFF